MVKKLTPTNINKLTKELKEFKKVIVLGEYEVGIQVNARESQIDKIVMDYLTIFEEASRNGEIDEEFVRGTGALLHTIMIRELTDVPSIPKSNKLKDILPYALSLYDAGIKNPGDVGLMAEILSHFDRAQTQRIYNKIASHGKTIGQALGEFVVRNVTVGEILKEEAKNA